MDVRIEKNKITIKEKKKIIYKVLKELGIIKGHETNWGVTIGGNETEVRWIQKSERMK